MGQEFEQGTVNRAFLCSLMPEAGLEGGKVGYGNHLRLVNSPVWQLIHTVGWGPLVLLHSDLSMSPLHVG